MKTVSSKTEFYLALEAVRGIAAVLVAIWHIRAFLPIRAPYSYLAVDLFFMLSGCVLAHRYESALTSARMSMAAFIKNRLIRIYPLYLIGSLIGFGILVAFGGVSQGKLVFLALLGLLFLPAPDLPIYYPFNAPSWSLFFELVFSFLYGYWLAFRSSGTIAIFAAVSFAGLVWGIVLAGNVDIGFQPHMFVFGFFRIGFSFSIGVLIFRYLDVLRMFFARRGPVSIWIVYALTGVALAMPLSHHFHTLAMLYDCLALLFILPLIVILAMLSRPTGVMARLSIGLGVLSYPLYVLHAPLNGLITHSLAKSGINVLDYAPLAGFAVLALIVPVSFWFGEYIDVPIRKWIRSLSPVTR